MKDFIFYLVNNLILKPDELSVTESKEGDIFIYNIKVAKEDMGIIIGKEGRTIRSIRNLAQAKAIKDKVRIQIELFEN